MLLGIRERSQSWIMWIIIGLLILMFALWGIQSYLGPEAEPVVASVNDSEISLRYFQDQLQRQRMRLQNMRGGSLDLNDKEEQQLRREVLDAMIDEESIVQTATESGMLIGDEQLAQIIRSVEAFRDDNGFSQAQYENVLMNQGYRPGSFEHVFRRSLLISQVNSGITSSALVPDGLLDDIIALMRQQRSFSVLDIPASGFADQAAVSDGDIQHYYQEHQAELMRPEQVSVRYIVLEREKIADDIQVSDAEAEKIYEQEKDSYRTAEERSARHILVRVADKTNEAALAEARKKAEGIKQRLDAGEDFAELAKNESDDPGSAQQGGDLGYFPRGVMDAAFEEAAFSLGVGEISEPVQSAFGFHIIRVDAIKESAVKPFAEVKADIIRQVQLERAESRLAEQAEQFANLIFESPDTLEVAADAFGLEIQTTPPFGRAGGEGIAAEPRFVTAAFSDEVRQGNNSEPLELPDNRIVALRLDKYTPEEQRTLDEVKEQIRDRLVLDKLRDAAKDEGMRVVESLRSAADRQAVADQVHQEWVSHADVARKAPGIAPEIVAHAFRMPRPVGGNPSVSGVSLASGDYAVILLESVSLNESAAFDDAMRAELRKQVRKGYGDQAYAAFSKARRDESKVKVFEDKL